MPETRACLVLVTQAQLLPDNHCALWVFLVTCNMKMATRRTIWKHAIHAVEWLLNAFSVKHLKSAYLQCGLMPLDFRSYMERMPAWTKHVQMRMWTMLSLNYLSLFRSVESKMGYSLMMY